MTDLLVDLRGLLRGLHENGVEYVVFGAIAMIFYGYVRSTEEFDIVLNPERENIERMVDWLGSLGPRERCGLDEGSNATVLTPLGRIDIVQRLAGLPEWSRLVDEAEVYEIEDMRVQVLNRHTLIDLKRRRGSHLDLADIDAIEQLAEL